ncbi:hypothetical protein NI456_11240 [Brevundimonas diminuta]|uniref:hypothetical protein n=1 Tax=Brevundimonas diminuta TaxID=293 RepID=UPI002096BE32|nr:hypothetical protein [Brevundimonas diminuta]MCO8019431.1 hypothetical protein [Brevundimonas diminuta]MCO8022109.1 hypothetical protein [Brevundimonas diminuta]
MSRGTWLLEKHAELHRPSMTNFPSPEALGDIGEDEFRRLCSRAELVCNKSERDKTGWDFRVEAPFDEDDPMALDQRAPRVCQVQVKATKGESGSRVTAKLSAVERLAKDSAPAAIVIMRLRRDGAPLAIYVVHLIDHVLGRVLERLRRAAAGARRDINRIMISFDYSKAQRFDPTPDGLRKALDGVWGEDIAAYTERKQHQLANLGYPEGGGFEAEALVWIEGKDHLIRILSGLEPVKPLRVKAYDRRFDIRLPYTGALRDGLAEIRLEPPTVGPCEITIRKGPRDPVVVFSCEAVVPLPLEEGPLLVVRHPMLTVIYREDGLSFETVGNFGGGRRSLEDWAQLMRGLTYLASGTGSIALEYRQTRLTPLAVPQDQLHGPYTGDLPNMLAFVEGWRDCLALAGVSATELFSIDDLWSAQPVHLALDILMNPKPIARLEFDVIDGAEGEGSLDALYFNTATFAGASIAYAVKVTLARSGVNADGFASIAFELVDIRPAVKDLKSYGYEQAAEHQLIVVIDPDNVELVEASTISNTELATASVPALR